MKKNTLLITGIIFSQMNTFSQGSIVRTQTSSTRFNTPLTREHEYLPFAFEKQLSRLRGFCELVDVKNIINFLRNFLETMPKYKHYRLEAIFFDFIKLIINSRGMGYNRIVRILLEQIEDEFKTVRKFINPSPRHPIFFQTMPWHDTLAWECVQENNVEKLKETLRNCLIVDKIHNVPKKKIADLWFIYKQITKSNGMYDNELADIFRQLKEMYPIYLKKPRD